MYFSQKPADVSFANLTHLPLDKMAAIPPTTFSNEFTWIQILFFALTFTDVPSWGYDKRNQSIGSDNGLAPFRRQAIIWTNADPVHWRIYVAH